MKITLIALLLGAATGSPAFADTVFDFGLFPAGGFVAGAPGSTVGWGYSITNDDASEWLSLTGASSTITFQYGTLNPLFDFPVLAPGQTVTVPWSPGAAGIFEFALDPGAPAGLPQTGDFTVTAEWYYEDPSSADCQFDDSSTSVCFDNFPTQTQGVASFTLVATPEPSYAPLLLAAWILFFAVRRAGRTFRKIG